jgi:hypothetical protein
VHVHLRVHLGRPVDGPLDLSLSANVDHVINYTLQFLAEMAHGAKQNRRDGRTTLRTCNWECGYYGHTPVAQWERQTP